MSIYVRIWDISDDLHNTWIAIFYHPDARDKTRYLLIIDTDWAWLSPVSANKFAPRQRVEFGTLPLVAQRRIFEAAADLY